MKTLFLGALYMLKKIAFSGVGILLFATPLISSAITTSDAQAQIQALLAQIATLQAGLQGSTPSSNAQPDDYGTGTTSASTCPKLSLTMQRGSRDATTGGQVSALQVFLANRFNLNDDDVVTGYFGGITERYVKQLQTDQGLPALGIVGSLTRATIARICAGSMPTSITSPTPNSSCTISTNKTTAVPGEQFTISWTTTGMASPVMYQQVKGGGTVAIATSGSMPWTAEPVPAGFTQIDTFEIGSGGIGAPYKPVCSIAVSIAMGAVPQPTTITTQPQASLGTYQGFINNQLFITTQNISQADALVNCQSNANNNPTATAGVRCTWNGIEIFSRPVPTITPPSTVSSGGVTISTVIQPANSLAPQGVINLAFTRFSLTNNGSAPVTLSNPAGLVAVTLSGLAPTAAFKSVVLIDSNGNRVGSEKSFLNATNKQVAVGDSIILGAGETRTYVIAGNMADSLNSFVGMPTQLSVVGINASQGIVGNLPITGASHTVNATLVACPDPNHIFGYQCPVTQMVTQTTAVGTLFVSTDTSSPSYQIAAGGSGGVVLGVYKFRASNESITLNRTGLKLGNSAASSDLNQVTLWANNAQVGTATFVGTGRNATSSLSAPLLLPRDTDVTVVIRGDLAQIGTSQPGIPGDLITVDIDTNGSAGNKNTRGIGVTSGNNIDAVGSTAVAGVRIFRSFPTVAQVSAPTGTLVNGNNVLLRFKITASALGQLSIGKLAPTFSTTNASVSSMSLCAYTDSTFSAQVSNQGACGSGAVPVPSGGSLDNVYQSPLVIPAGATYYFEVRGTVVGASNATSVTTKLTGDNVALSGMNTFASLYSSGGNFIWSPNTLTTSAKTDADWTNGYNLPGFSAGSISQVLTGSGASTPPPPTAQSCTLAGGATLAPGQSGTFYVVSTATSSSSCATLSQIRTCTNGNLSGDATYTNSSCTITPPAAPALADVHVISMYQAVGSVNDFCHSDWGSATVTIDPAARSPLILALSSYEPVKWNIVNTGNKKIEKIIFTGYHAQMAVGAVTGVPIEHHSFYQVAKTQVLTAQSNDFFYKTGAVMPAMFYDWPTDASCKATSGAIPLAGRRYFIPNSEYAYASSLSDPEYQTLIAKLKTWTGQGNAFNLASANIVSSGSSFIVAGGKGSVVPQTQFASAAAQSEILSQIAQVLTSLMSFLGHTSGN